MKTKKQITESQSINKLNENIMKVENGKKIAKSVYKSCIESSYLGSEDDARNSPFYRGLESLFDRYRGEADYLIDIDLVFDRYHIRTTPRYDNDGFAIPCIDKNNKIQEIIEFVVDEEYFGFLKLDGEMVGTAYNVWAKDIEYYDERWGNKTCFSGAEIMRRRGYTLQKKNCFIGENLLGRDKERPVIITKYPIEAVLLSLVDNAHIYLSLGCCNKEFAAKLDSIESKELLKGRDVKVLSTFDGSPAFTQISNALKRGASLSSIREDVYKHCTKLKI